MSLQPGNVGGSLLLMERVQDARSGGHCFEDMNEAERLEFLTRFSQEVAALARAGFVHRDLHYDNLLLDPQGNIIWIDAHVRRLPRQRDRHWAAIQASLTVNKLRGEHYRAFVEQRLREQLPA
ncbi:phosphotransferase [Oceanimonas sp. NS1]|nr:phosphotransferase [Oceanimonas sp. NS1]